MQLRRKQVDTVLERKILIGFIVSDIFCRKVLPITKIEYFTLPYARRVIEWVQDYYGKYEKALFHHIQDIFEVERERIKPAEAELIEEFLLTLNEQYQSEQDLNVDYLIDQALLYYRRRSLEIVSDRIRTYLDKGSVEDAEKVLRGYKDVGKDVSGWENPFDPDAVWEVFEYDTARLFTFPGVLGELMGPLERGWLVGVMGPMKRGKSWMLQEFAVQAVVSRKRALYVSLEMPVRQIKARLLKRVTGQGFEEGDLFYPCFDCKRNQDGSCTRKERASSVSLLAGGKGLPSFEDTSSEYRPCTYCRDHGLSGYVPAIWFFSVKAKSLSYPEAVRKLRSFTTMFGDRLRVRSYPAFSATLGQIVSDIENLEYTEDFTPDVIVIDYADIVASSRRSSQEWERVDDIWKSLKRLAMEKHCLVVTATQTRRSGISKKSVSEEDTAKDIDKLAHVDLLLTLNQTPKEKEIGLMRIGVLVKREGKYSKLRQVAVLTNLTTGQFLLDSEWWSGVDSVKS